MPLPDRPVAAASIETEWGQAIHDYTFAPSGFECHGSDTVTSTSITQIAIDVADEDPGGFVDTSGNRAVIPTDRAGLYHFSLLLYSVDGVDTNRTRGFIYVNGSEIRRNIEENQTGGTITVGISTDKRLSAGDIVTIHAQKVGSGSNLNVKIKEFIMYRVGDSLGA